MMDFNILNRARFQESTLVFAVTVNPGTDGIHLHELNGGVFCLKHAGWKYSVGGGQIDPYGWPKVPMRISINNAVIEQTASPIVLSPPAILSPRIEVKIHNPSNLRVTIHLTIKGELAVPIDGSPSLSEKEVLGYSLLDDSQKGMLALQEAAMDRLDDQLRQLGVDSGIRNQMLAGQVNEALGLPGIQTALGLPEAQTPLALSTGEATKKTQEELKSLLVGDMVQYKLKNSSDISLEEIQSLTDFLLDKDWHK